MADKELWKLLWAGVDRWNREREQDPDRFKQADLTNANLENAQLTYANLSDVDLSGAYLHWANLTSAKLCRANLSGANLIETDLTGADFRGTRIDKVNLYFAKGFMQNQLDVSRFVVPPKKLPRTRAEDVRGKYVPGRHEPGVLNDLQEWSPWRNTLRPSESRNYDSPSENEYSSSDRDGNLVPWEPARLENWKDRVTKGQVFLADPDVQRYLVGVWIEEGDARRKKGDYLSAAFWYKHALLTYEHCDIALYVNIAYCLVHLEGVEPAEWLARVIGRPEELLELATERLEHEIASSPSQSSPHSNYGAFLSTLNKPEAVEYFRKAIALGEDDEPVGYYHLACCLKRLGRTEEAVENYRKAISIWPEMSGAHSELANCLRHLGRFEDAVAHARQAVALEPEDAFERLRLADSLRDLGQRDEVLEQVRQAIALAPDNANAHLILGEDLAALGQYDVAAEHGKKAVTLDPEDAMAHNNLAYYLFRLDRLRDAEKSVRRALKLEPKLFEALDTRGLLLEARGEFDKAIKYFRKALKSQPDNEEVRRNLERVLEKADQQK